MRRLVIGSLSLTALLLACLPTEPCACLEAPASFLVFGSVQRAGGAPVAGARVRFSASSLTGSTVCASGTSSPLLDSEATAATDGRFRSVIRSMAGAGQYCLRAVAFAGAAGASDSAVVDGLIVQFHRGADQPDSLGISLTLP